MGTSLDDALDGKSASDDAVEPAQEDIQTAEAPEQVAETGDTPSAEPEPSDEEPKGWQYAAYKDEKTKRQELEKSNSDMQAQMADIQRQNAEYQNWINQQQAQHQQQQDPQGAHVQQMVGQQVGQVEATMRLNTSRLLHSQSLGADKVQAAEQAFHGLQATNPAEYQALVQQFGVHQDPIGQVLQWHKRHDMISKMGDDPEAFITAQAEAKAKEMLAQMQQVPDPQAPNAPVMPTDLSQTRNVGTRSGSNWGGPTSLGKALGE